jgi:hypothetical protein
MPLGQKLMSKLSYLKAIIVQVQEALPNVRAVKLVHVSITIYKAKPISRIARMGLLLKQTPNQTVTDQQVVIQYAV